jgi:DNA-binding transcriptional LysR family regulator
MELRHLRYFMAVAEAGHITGAAERLGIQQPPLSRLIKWMERELDVQLFRRRARGVELTEAGRAFRDRARALLADFDKAFEVTRSTARGEQGQICVGVTPTGPFLAFVPRAIRAFRQAYPLVSLTLEERLSSELVEHLRTGRIDSAFLWTPPTEGLVISALLQEPLVVALPRRHPLAQNLGDPHAGLSLRALADDTFIVYGRKDGFGLFAATIVACRAAGFSPRFGQEAPRLATALGLVSIGLGIALVPASVQRLRIDGVVYRHLKGPTRPKSTLNLAHRRGESSAVVRHFVALVKKAAKARADGRGAFAHE